MNDIPMFATENGVASLTLKQIPAWGLAYITFGASENPELLLRECAEFCRSCGAERVFASGFPEMDGRYSEYTRILGMQILKENLTGEIAELWPLLPENSEKWRKLYNSRMCGVDHAAYLDFFDMKQHLRDGDCYFIHKGDRLLGIGKASGDTVSAVASSERGSGEILMRTLATLLSEETIRLEVASTNEKAIRLYSRLGFLPCEEKEIWYEIP